MISLKEEIQPKTRVWRRKEVLFSEIDDQVIALDAQAGYCYSLTGPGNHIWELIETPQTVETVCAQLRQVYSVDEETCFSDVAAWIAELRDAGVIAITNQPNE